MAETDTPMLRWFWRLLYQSTPAEFRSGFGLEESVERLRAATKRSVFSALSETAAVGKVTEKSVRLQRVIPMFGNSFKPFFLGQFQSGNGQVLLVGRFTMLPMVKVFMTFWLGVVSLTSVGFLFGLKSTTPAPAVLVPFLMLGGGVAMLAFGKWLARNDVAWLSEVIEGALKSAGTSGAAPVMTTVDPTVVPITLKAAAIFLAVSGVMALFSGLIVPQLPTIPTSAGGAMPFSPTGQWPFVYAATVLTLAMGVWRRQPWAWWGFFILLGASACGSMYAMQAMGNVGPPWAMRLVFGVMSAVVTLLWGCWWYGQRKYFIEPTPH
jgi:hypothetical protein